MFEDDLEVVRKYYTGIFNDDFSVIDELISPGFISHYKRYMPSDPDEIKADLLEALDAFTDCRNHIDRIYADGDGKVFIKVTAEQRQIAPYRGTEPDYQIHRICMIECWRVEDGQLMEYYPPVIASHEVL